MIRDILRKIGLTDKEIVLFLKLIEYGTRPASFLAQKAGLNRSTAYDILESLVRKSLVYQTVIAQVKNFTAFPPEKLLDYLDKRSAEFLELKSDVSGIIGDLESLRDPHQILRPKFRFFQGVTGVRDLLDDTLNTKEKDIYAVLSMEDMYDTIGESYYEKQIQKRIKNGIHLNVIRAFVKDTIKDRWPSDGIHNRTVRYMPENVTPPDMSFYLYNGNKTAFFSSKKEDYGLLIESKELYQTQKMLFDNFWKDASTN